MPVTALQNDQATLQSEATGLGSLQTAVGNLAQAITALGSLSSGGALTATSSDTNVGVTVSGTGATAGTYTISNVTSLASLSSATMTNGVADPTSTAVAPTDTNTLYLVAGGSPITLQLTSQTNNLNGLRDAINAANAGVTASVLTTSQGSYLTMTATQAGATQIQLLTNSSDPATDLMSMDHTGSLAQFQVNGKPATSSTNQVTGVIAGVTLNLKAVTQTGESATITVAANSQPVITALQGAVSSYNALLTAVDAEFGSNAGALNGNSVVLSIQNLMRQFAFYQGTGGVQSLMDLGVSLDKTGEMSLDTSVLSSMSSGQLSNALSFIGNSTTGLASPAGSFTAYSDSVTGVLQQQITQDQKSAQSLQDQIDTMSVRIAAAQKSEMSKLEAADALLAQLDSQQSMLTSTIQSLNYTLYGASLTNQNGTIGG
jgi:flagellar hook-associated protein 2